MHGRAHAGCQIAILGSGLVCALAPVPAFCVQTLQCYDETSLRMTSPLISVLIVVRNGSQDIIGALDSIAQQDYSPLEVLVVDGLSDDNTKALAAEYAARHPNFALRVLDNPGRIQASGWNVGIRAASGNYILRLDGVHCRLERGYIHRCLEELLKLQQTDATVAATGGRRLSVTRTDNPWSEAIALAQCSRFGVGNATYRLGTQSGFTDTLGVPLYNRDILFKVGLFNEALGRSEDNELHARLRQQGYKLYFLADAVALYHPRTSLPEVAHQMFHNGWWVSATIVRLRSFPFGIRHLVPFLFWLTLLVTGALSAVYFSPRVLFCSLLACYLLASLAAAIQALPARGAWRIAVVFWCMHASYAAGTAAGFFPRTNEILSAQSAQAKQ